VCCFDRFDGVLRVVGIFEGAFRRLVLVELRRDGLLTVGVEAFGPVLLALEAVTCLTRLV
jgi:hypothetical protein